MLRSPQVTFSCFKLFAVLLLPILLSGCAITFVKKYPKNTPFVYRTNIKVEGDLPASDKRELETKLQNQLDDSLRVRTKSYPLWKTIRNPPVFDTNNVKRSEAFMNELLKSQGYFGGVIKDTATVDTVKDQVRVTVDFRVMPGKGLRFDSIAYNLTTPEWQQLAKSYEKQSLLKKNARYSKLVIGQELDRVIELLRNNGYYKVNKEDVYAEADTIAFALIDPTLDPFEQAILLQQLQEKQENPTVNVVIKQRPIKDSSHVRPFYINKVTIYPDVPVIPDSLEIPVFDTTIVEKFTIISQSDKFKKRFLSQYSYLKPGDLYRQSRYLKTITTFNQLGAWSQANVDVYETLDNDSTLDVEITLYPSKKYALILDLETTLNNANSSNVALVATSNLFGVGVNVGLRNRNFARQSIQSTSNLRYGVELGKNIVQTMQISFAQNFYFPKFILMPVRPKNYDSLVSPRTIMSFNTAYTDRRLLYRINSINLSFGWEWGRNNHIWFYRPANLEFTNLFKRDSFYKLEDENPSLKYAFNDGTVIGQQVVYRWGKKSGTNRHSIRASFEQSGVVLGFIPIGLIDYLDIDAKLFQFVKGELQYTFTKEFKKSALAFRALGGLGVAYGDSSKTVKERILPFFKQFYAGGPNSMRAWQVRQLGLGSNKNASFDRFGDVQLEANVEYRFVLTSFAGIQLGSAFYIDVGNIWLRKDYGDTTQQNADFKLSRLGQDIAVGTGTGLRFDFNFFLIRLDYAYKVKDPNREAEPDKLFYNWKLFNGQLQLGVNYPF